MRHFGQLKRQIQVRRFQKTQSLSREEGLVLAILILARIRPHFVRLFDKWENFLGQLPFNFV